MSSHMPAKTISVIMPTYNHAAFVETAMWSVSRQDFSAKEFIIVDDRSQDNTPQIVEELAANEEFSSSFDSLRFIRNDENIGAAASLNKGMELASGDYYTFINSDDIYAPRRLSLMLDALHATGRRFGFSRVLPVNLDGLPSFDQEFAFDVYHMASRAVYNLPSTSFGFLGRQIAVSTGNLFFHRSIYEQVGGFRDLKYVHDWDYALRIIEIEEPVYLEEPLYYYRLHDDNTFRRVSGLAVLETRIVLSRYFKSALSGQVRNREAPTNENWPHLFELYTEIFGVRTIWDAVLNKPTQTSRMVDLADAHR